MTGDIWGELLPEQTEDDLDPGWGERAEDPEADRDLERLLRDRPPHHLG